MRFVVERDVAVLGLHDNGVGGQGRSGGEGDEHGGNNQFLHDWSPIQRWIKTRIKIEINRTLVKGFLPD